MQKYALKSASLPSGPPVFLRVSTRVPHNDFDLIHRVCIPTLCTQHIWELARRQRSSVSVGRTDAIFYAFYLKHEVA